MKLAMDPKCLEEAAKEGGFRINCWSGYGVNVAGMLSVWRSPSTAAVAEKMRRVARIY